MFIRGKPVKRQGDRNRNGSDVLMKSSFYLVLTTVFLLCSSPVLHAKLIVTPPHCNMGTVDEGVPARTTVTVENRGDRSVVITNVRTN
jgi:hypothetical protein